MVFCQSSEAVAYLPTWQMPNDMAVNYVRRRTSPPSAPSYRHVVLAVVSTDTLFANLFASYPIPHIP